mmetsp:Transcript_898/g.2271  ORF Transcript_898/g.2271 Transcript_898/m.2271 type:complete len:82 (+) Transcript_898:1588-1833(+)
MPKKTNPTPSHPWFHSKVSLQNTELSTAPNKTEPPTIMGMDCVTGTPMGPDTTKERNSPMPTNKPAPIDHHRPVLSKWKKP